MVFGCNKNNILNGKNNKSRRNGIWRKDLKVDAISFEQVCQILDLTIAEYSAIRTVYYHAIYNTVDGYLNSQESIVQSKKDMQDAIAISYGATAAIAWHDGNGDMLQASAVSVLLKSTIDQQQGYAGQLFERLKLLRPQLEQGTLETHLTIQSEAEQRAQGYSKSLDFFYAIVKLMALGDTELMFGGPSGQESCHECDMLLNTWHPASWYVANGYVPPRGENLSCHEGGHCEHTLSNHAGQLVTI